MNPQRRALVAFAALALVAHRAGADVPGANLLQRIAAARGKIRTLQGPFTQVRRIGVLASDVRSSGDVAVIRPDRLRWRLGPPDDVTFWVGPEGLAYRSAHGQERLAPAKGGVPAALDDLCTLIGGDLAKLDRRWSLRLLRDAADGVEIEATAREGAAAGVRSMTFALTGDLTRPTRVSLVEGPRDRTDIVFGELRMNEPLDEAGMRPP